MKYLEVLALALSLTVSSSCTPEQCEEFDSACPFNDCGPCPCPVGSICVEGNACASLCALDVLHDPPGNSCGFIRPDAMCSPQSGTPAPDIGVCRGPTGAPLCSQPGDT